MTPSVVITANHCFEVKLEYVRAGVTRIDQANPQDRRIREHRTHPDHNNKDWYYDLALVFLMEELNFNRRVSALCLPSEPSPHPGDGVGVLVQGWGEDFLGDSGIKVTQTKVNIRSKASHPFILSDRLFALKLKKLTEYLCSFLFISFFQNCLEL